MDMQAMLEAGAVIVGAIGLIVGGTSRSRIKKLEESKDLLASQNQVLTDANKKQADAIKELKGKLGIAV